MTPSKRGKGNKAGEFDKTPTPAERRGTTYWVYNLKRMFNIGIRFCTDQGESWVVDRP